MFARHEHRTGNRHFAAPGEEPRDERAAIPREELSLAEAVARMTAIAERLGSHRLVMPAPMTCASSSSRVRKNALFPSSRQWLFAKPMTSKPASSGKSRTASLLPAPYGHSQFPKVMSADRRTRSVLAKQGLGVGVWCEHVAHGDDRDGV